MLCTLVALLAVSSMPVDTVTIDARNADVEDVARLFFEPLGVAVIVDDDAHARVSVHIVDMRWDLALEQILRAHGLGYQRRGGFLRIGRQGKIDVERAAAARLTLCY